MPVSDDHIVKQRSSVTMCSGDGTMHKSVLATTTVDRSGRVKAFCTQVLIQKNLRMPVSNLAQ